MACSTHHGASAPMTAIQRFTPELTPDHASAPAKVTNVKSAQMPNAAQYGSKVNGATNHATVGGLRNGWDDRLATRFFCAAATSAWSYRCDQPCCSPTAAAAR